MEIFTNIQPGLETNVKADHKHMIHINICAKSQAKALISEKI